MDLRSHSQSHDLSQHANLISIPQLSPDLQDPDRYSFKAVVTLVWPFSSSNRLFSLLLAEPDFRLRNQNGQIRVTFCGRCAEEVALTKVGIGDTVTLGLQGAKWTENKKIQSTPGKSLSWELQFENRLKFEATRNGEKIAILDVDRPPTPRENVLATDISTPARFNGSFATPNLSQERWETPAFLRTKRLLSPGPLQSSFDPFAEEDGYIPGKGRKRPRFSFPSSGWRLVDEPDGFTEDFPENDDNWFESDEEKLDGDYGDNESATKIAHEIETLEQTLPETSSAEGAPEGGLQSTEPTMQIPPTDTIYKEGTESLQTISSSPEQTFVERSLQDTPISSKTPHLDPISSPNIPTPSPLVSTPAEHLSSLHGLPSSSVSVQPQLSHSANNDLLSHDTRQRFTTDAHNAGPWGDVQVHPQGRSIFGLDVESNTRSEYSDVKVATTIGHAEPSIRSSPFGDTTESPVLHTERINTTINEPDQTKFSDYRPTDREDLAGKGVEVVDGELGERQHIYEGATDAERLGDVREIKEDEVDQIDGGSNSMAEEDEEDTQYSESEEIVDEENAVSFQRIAVEGLISTGYRSRHEDAEAYDSDLEDRDLSDDAEEDSEEIMSEELETDIGSESESDDEFYEEPVLEPEIPRRIVHPEVIVIDSDSEDEPPKPNRPPAMQERVASNGPSTSSYIHGNDFHRYDEYMEEERDEYSDEKDEENDAGLLQSDTDLYGYEHRSRGNLPVHDAYISDEETLFKDGLQSENDEELDTHSIDRDEPAVDQGNITSPTRSAENEPVNDTMHLDTIRTRLTPEVRGDKATFDKNIVELEEQGRVNSPGFKVESIEGHETEVSAKEGQSLSSSQILGQEHYLTATRTMQRLVYRTASPMPVPTPPSTLNDEPPYKTVETKADVTAEHGSPPSVSDVVAPETIDDRSHRRWTDGSDEGAPREFNGQSSSEEPVARGIIDENDGASEKFDEVVLVEGHSTQSDLGNGRQLYNYDEPDAQADITTPDAPIRELKVYPTLATLDEWLNKMVDIISVVVDILPAERATPASEEYYLRLRVTDISMAGTTIVVDIAGPRETSLLAMTEGDVILLNNFEVQSLDGSLKLASSDSSDWVIFRNTTDVPHIMNPMMASGEHEHGYVRTLQNWYREDGAAMAADHMLQLSISQEDSHPSPFSIASSIAGSVDSGATEPVSRPRPRRKKSHRRITIHELRDGRRYTEGGPQSSDLIHELRDGTVYAHSFGRD